VVHGVELLKSHYLELTLGNLAEIQKQSALERAEEPEPEPEEGTMMIARSTVRLGLSEAGIKVFEDIDANEQQAATIREGIMMMLACYEEIVKEKERSLSHQTSALDSFKSSSGTHASLPVLLDIGNDSDDPPTVREEVSPPSIVICLSVHTFVNFLISRDLSCF
jgi:lipopolysaccharide biosynthesis regulator YciM